MLRKYNPFHLVTQRPWPLILSRSIINIILQITLNLKIIRSKTIRLSALLSLALPTMVWWKDTIKEARKEGTHQKIVVRGVKIAIVLFILSEILFFIRFFWAYFSSGISPRVDIGQIWPPTYIKTFNPLNVPLLNTTILIRSGVTVTWSHHAILVNKLNTSKQALMATCILGVYFSTLQLIEYNQAEFSISDNSYGTIFFIGTGFHGLHVIIGTTFLVVNFLIIKNIKTSTNHHTAFEIAAWYWHFVDIVWLFLYTSIYWWGA